MIKKYLIILTIFLTVTQSNAQNVDAENENLTDLISQWEHRDGVNFISLSFELSKEFLKNDSLFLERMYHNKKVFNAWVDKLQTGVFTAYEAGNDSIEQQLYYAFYDKLKNMMLEKVKLNKDSKYCAMLKKLKFKLENTTIRFID